MPDNLRRFEPRLARISQRELRDIQQRRLEIERLQARYFELAQGVIDRLLADEGIEAGPLMAELTEVSTGDGIAFRLEIRGGTGC